MLAKISQATHRTFYAVFRILVGVLFASHGAQKLFGWFGGPGLAGFAGYAQVPVWVAGVIGCIEFFGGLLIAVGLFTRTAAVFTTILAILIFSIAHTAANGSILPWVNKGELILLYLSTFLVIFSHGAGAFSLEKALFKKEQF